MSIFKDFVLARPVKTPLDFGYNENIIIDKIDFGERKKNGIKIKANTFIKLTKINPKTKETIANTEINFWDLDHTRDFVYDNFISQFSILCGIVDALGGDVTAYESAVLDVVEGEGDNEMAQFLKKAANATAAQKALIEGFKVQVQDKIGPDSKLLKCKMISNKSGYLQPANDMSWILAQDNDEDLPNITSRETRVYETALKTDKKSKPDTPGSAPTETKVASDSLSSI